VDADDPFNGVWTFSPQDSRVTGPPPRSWTQTISVSGEAVRVREEINFRGLHLDVRIDARFDGAEYPVVGSPVGDSVAYRRVDELEIAGVVKKNGRVALTETIRVSSDRRRLTATYRIAHPEGDTSSVAVFTRFGA
jgi:hypothetical protein